MPSGPGAEWPDILIALVMSLSRIRQSSEAVGKLGLVWHVLGASLLGLWWTCGKFACDACALESLFGVLLRGRELLELSEEAGDVLREVIGDASRSRGRGCLEDR